MSLKRPMIKERKRRHDDAHFPLQGRGKRATKRKATTQVGPRCPDCGKYPAAMAHICDQSLRKNGGQMSLIGMCPKCHEQTPVLPSCCGKGAIIEGDLMTEEAADRLLGAASELLGWLKSVLRQMEYERPRAEETYTNGTSGLFGMKENLEKVIAKAEGK